MKKHIFFDLDGTLTNSKLGITKSIEYALNKFEIQVENLTDLEKFIGPSLKFSFMKFYSFSEDNALKAINFFRERYSTIGIYENEMYTGIRELLEKLHRHNINMAITTGKGTPFAKKIIEHFELNKFFIEVFGSNLDNTRTEKREVITYALQTLNYNQNEIIVVGDRDHDILGATKNGIESIGVLYGYGSQKEIQQAHPTYISKTVAQLEEIITNIYIY